VSATDIEELYRFATLRQIHESTGVGYSTLRARVRDGSLPAFTVRNGRKLLIRVADVQALFQQVQSKPQGAQQ
jgi:excisionase family DNA binding protein